MSLASQIESVQPDVFYKLTSEPYFNAISVFNLREKRLDSEVNKALAGKGALSTVPFSRPGTKVGATIEILMPTLLAAYENTPGPVCTLEQVFMLKTQETINLGANGSGLSAEQIAVNIAQTFQLFNFGNYLQGLYPAPVWYQPIPTPPDVPYLQIKVTMRGTFQLTAAPRQSRPAYADASNNNGTDTVTLTDTQPGGGSVIYYTIDGTFPGPANPTAQKYSAPFVVPAQTIVRATAWASTTPPGNGSFVTDYISS